MVGDYLLVGSAGPPLPVGTPVLLADVSHYAPAWNPSFAGVPAATMLVLAESDQLLPHKI